MRRAEYIIIKKLNGYDFYFFVTVNCFIKTKFDAACRGSRCGSVKEERRIEDAAPYARTVVIHYRLARFALQYVYKCRGPRAQGNESALRTEINMPQGASLRSAQRQC